MSVHKVLVIADREYRAIVGTKAFLMALTIMPVLMFGGIFIQKLCEGRVGPAEKRIVVFDGTGVLFESCQKAAGTGTQTHLRPQDTGKQIKPRYVLEAGPGHARRGASVSSFPSGFVAARSTPSWRFPRPCCKSAGQGPPAKVALSRRERRLGRGEELAPADLGDLVRVRAAASRPDSIPHVVDRATAPVIVEPLGLVERDADRRDHAAGAQRACKR